MNQLNKLKQLNMVVLPRTGRSFYSIVVSHKLIYAVVGVLLLALLLNTYLFTCYFRMKKDVSDSQRLIKVGMEVSSLKEETEAIKDDLEYIKETNKRIQQKTGINSEPGYVNRVWENREVAMPTRSLPPELESIREQLRIFQTEISSRKQSIRNTDKKIDSLIKKFAVTPSLRPTGGGITSGFGYRIHPVYGVRAFHMGVDISGDPSTPVYAVADGKVNYSGWRQGYGETVMIQHANGFETLYGHNSRNLVSDGEKVKKGQIISYVGCTGLCTGDHVHYEVHYENRVLNPMKFLNLNLKDMEEF